MMKGYLTVFLALSLSVMTGFVLLLTGGAVRNAGKVRLECAVDTGMNAVLSEFHTVLLERYDLVYVDISYLGQSPSISNMEDHLYYYVEENTSKVLEGENAPWGRIMVENVSIPDFETAAADLGASMRNQAVCYVEDTGISGKEREVFSHMDEIRKLDAEDPMGQWGNVMDQLAGMELPKIEKEEGVWEEVPLSNPADWVYAIAGSDLFYLANISTQSMNPAKISLQDYISHRKIVNTHSRGRMYREDEDLFLSYLFDKMGNFLNPREDSLLSCQLEYLAYGKNSDLGNMKAVSEKLLKWRFADNASRALSDGSLKAKVISVAEQLLAVGLNEAFKAPVVESILYACAFLESVGDVQAIFNGGSIPIRKSGHQMSVDNVLTSNFYCTNSSTGFSYGQYLAAMILMVDETKQNLRAMDIMEMDLRYHDGNRNFSMDWCVERFEAKVACRGGYGDHYLLDRKYGYF
ncbi:hypothetical protein IMSAGC019_02049 [Lachnospiraceae bacterium]|nr:hypothetical protein IMSAGC019_02049 [Lachnospiraceae bacterium]